MKAKLDDDDIDDLCWEADDNSVLVLRTIHPNEITGVFIGGPQELTRMMVWWHGGRVWRVEDLDAGCHCYDIPARVNDAFVALVSRLGREAAHGKAD